MWRRFLRNPGIILSCTSNYAYCLSLILASSVELVSSLLTIDFNCPLTSVWETLGLLSVGGIGSLELSPSSSESGSKYLDLGSGFSSFLIVRDGRIIPPSLTAVFFLVLKAGSLVSFLVIWLKFKLITRPNVIRPLTTPQTGKLATFCQLCARTSRTVMAERMEHALTRTSAPVGDLGRLDYYLCTI